MGQKLFLALDGGRFVPILLIRFPAMDRDRARDRVRGCVSYYGSRALVIPRKLVSSIYQLSIDEQSAVWGLVAEVRERLLTGLKPDGFNIGGNDGSAVWQTIDHAHVHVRPRRNGDVPDPRGGIRWIIDDKANYWAK